MTRDTDAWYGETGEWVPYLDRRLQERPSGHAEPTDQDRYYDASTMGVAAITPDPADVPWTDSLDNHEAEL